MDALIYIGKASSILSLFYIVYALLLKSDTHFTTNRLFLGSGLLLSSILPFIQLTRTVTIPVAEIDPATYSENIPTHLTSAPQQFDWWHIVGILYFLIAGVFFIRFLKQFFSLLLILKKHPATINNGFKYIRVSETILPFSFFNYIVYNPSLHSEEELAMILNHEKVHAYQKHSIDILVAHLITIFQWANPIAWFYKKNVEENLEYIADQETAAMVSSKKEYQIALVKTSSTYSVPALATNFYQSFTKKRIVMLNKNSSKKVNALKFIVILPLLALFLWSFNVNEKILYTEAEPASVVNTSLQSNKNTSETQLASNTISKTADNAEISEKTLQKVTSKQRNNTISQDSVKGFQVRITKNTTVEELEAYKQKLKKEHNATFKYSNLNFNSKGEITGVSISYSDKRGNNNNYSVSSDQPINDFVLAVSENGSISSRTVLTEEQEMQRQKMMAERDKMISERKKQLKERQEELKERLEERKKTMKYEAKARAEAMKSAAKARAKAIKRQKNDSTYFIINGNRIHINEEGNYVNEEGTVIKYRKDVKGQNPIYYVDGKETKEVEVKKITPESIEKVNVLKGKKAIKKYGGKAVNGVIEITTKQ